MEKKYDFLTTDEFYEKYNPVKNHLDDNASFDGCMFETYDEEVEYVKQMVKENHKKVWTIVDGKALEDCDDDDCFFYNDKDAETPEEEEHLMKAHTPSTVYCAGWHYVNRQGYLITEEEWIDENEEYVDVF